MEHNNESSDDQEEQDEVNLIDDQESDFDMYKGLYNQTPQTNTNNSSYFNFDLYNNDQIIQDNNKQIIQQNVQIPN